MFRTFAVLLTAACISAAAVAAPYPVIHHLTNNDPLFKQYCADIADNYQESAKGGDVFCMFYSYVATADDSVISLSARCSLPYETIASLNRISSSKQDITGVKILLPTAAGLFVWQTNAQNDVERLSAAAVETENDLHHIDLQIQTGENIRRTVVFYPGRRYSPTERAFFLHTAFRFPLDEYVITSKFGMRNNPVTGNRRFHRGVDLGAPKGTAVHAVRAGLVTAIGTDSIFGNYVVIRHDNNWESFYAHLQTVKKNCLNRRIETGYSIGTVGSTGQSTGPHLHFELRESGSVRNPEDFLLQ